MKSQLSLADCVFLDLEGTGLDPITSRIVEIAVYDWEGRELLHSLVNPGIPIPYDARAVHGISDDDVAGAPSFGRLADKVAAIVEGAVLVGYSSRTYDVPLLDTELRRAGYPGLPRCKDDLIRVPEIDLYALWQEVEPRSLVGAARRFAGVELEATAHRAGNDAKVLPLVLRGMVEQLQALASVNAALQEEGEVTQVEELQALSVPPWAVDRGGRFRREDGDQIVFNFGQHRGKPVEWEPGVLEWMLRVDFPEETKAWCRRFLEEIEEARAERARSSVEEHYGHWEGDEDWEEDDYWEQDGDW